MRMKSNTDECKEKMIAALVTQLLQVEDREVGLTALNQHELL